MNMAHNVYPTAKRLGADQSYRWYQKIKSEAISCVNEHIRFMTTHEQFLDSINNRVYGHPVFTKLHSHYKNLIVGYIEGARNVIDMHLLEWRMYVDGELLNRKEMDLKDAAEKAQMNNSPDFKSVWHRIDTSLCAFVWAKDPTKFYSAKAERLIAESKSNDSVSKVG